jgi:O-antigen/teichoic acid export membrane protein
MAQLRSLKPGVRTIWFLVSNVVNAGISFLSMIFLARVLSPTEYGTLAIFFTSTAVLTSLVAVSVDGSVSIAYFRRSREELRVHISSGIALIFMVSASAALMVILYSAELTAWLHLPFEWLLLGLACAVAQAIINIKLVLWMVMGAARRYAAFQIGQGLVLACITTALVLGADIGWKSRATALVVTNGIFLLVAIYMIIRDDECVRAFSFKELRYALNFGVPLLPHICGALLFSSADRFLVNSLLGATATGLYQLAAQIGSIVMIVTDAVNKAFSPWLYLHLEEATDSMRRKIVGFTYVYFLIVLLVSLFFFMVPWNLAEYFGGRVYASAGLLVPLFILGHCIGGMYFMVVNYIFYVGRTVYLSVATLVSGLVGLGVAYVLISYVGVVGAGVAFVVGKSIHFILTWIISARIYPMPWMQLSRHK